MTVATHTKIGIINESLNMLDHFVALDAGFFRDEGLDVELVVQSGASAGMPATENVLVTSFAAQVVEAILLYRAPYKFVLINRREPPHYVVSRPEIKTVADLKGKTICGAGTGSTNYKMMVDWLRRNGLEPGRDVKIETPTTPPSSFFNGPTPDWARPLMRAAYDATMVVPPEWEWLTQVAGYNTLVELCEEYPNRMIHGLAAHEDTLKREPELIRKVVRAHIRAAQTIQNDRETTVQIVMQRWGLSRQVAEGVYQNMHWRFISETDPKWLKEELVYHTQHLKEQHPAAQIEIPDPATLIDASFVT